MHPREGDGVYLSREPHTIRQSRLGQRISPSESRSQEELRPLPKTASAGELIKGRTHLPRYRIRDCPRPKSEASGKGTELISESSPDTACDETHSPGKGSVSPLGT